jgi:ATP-dependent DNA ligase
MDETKIKIHSSPILQAKASKGHDKFWQCHILQSEDGERYWTQNSWWHTTKDGSSSKVQESFPVRISGVNVGKANETSDRAQAFAAFESDFKRQKEREGYLEEGEDALNNFTPPMLAHKFPDRRNRVVWTNGNYAQPKKDGCRFQMSSVIKAAWSRKLVEFHPRIVELFMFDTAGYTLDGELMMPDGYSQQQLMSAAATVDKKNLKEDLIPILEYHVFDLVDEDLPFPERLIILNEILKNAPKHLRITLLETRFVKDEAEFLHWHNIWSARGDEGSILRDGSSGYKVGHRSNSLLKHKDFQDDEFIIIDAVEGTGSFEGKAVFKCLLNDGTGRDFDVTPQGKMPVKEELLRNKHKYIGEPLTVKFQKYSDKGKPIFPVGISIRDRKLQG